MAEHSSDLALLWQPGVHFTNNRAVTSLCCGPAPSSHHKLESRASVTASRLSLTCKWSFYLRHRLCLANQRCLLFKMQVNEMKDGKMERRDGLESREVKAYSERVPV